MLRAATRHKTEVERLATVGEALARRAWDRGDVRTLVRALTLLQLRAVRVSVAAVEAAVAEQRMDAPAVGSVDPVAFVRASDGRSLSGLVAQADSEATLRLMAVTQIADTARVATGVSIAARPAITGYVREVGGACCSRCAILAGRFYRWSEGFQRHPGCQCVNVPTSNAGLAQSPAGLFRQGRITDMSRADRQAVDDGADITRVVNVRRSAAGLHTAGGRVLTRAGRPTPEAIYRIASDRAEAITLLRRNGYIT